MFWRRLPSFLRRFPPVHLYPFLDSFGRFKGKGDAQSASRSKPNGFFGITRTINDGMRIQHNARPYGKRAENLLLALPRREIIILDRNIGESGKSVSVRDDMGGGGLLEK